MKCVYCGTDIDADSRFCTHCGKPQASARSAENGNADSAPIDTAATTPVPMPSATSDGETTLMDFHEPSPVAMPTSDPTAVLAPVITPQPAQPQAGLGYEASNSADEGTVASPEHHGPSRRTVVICSVVAVVVVLLAGAYIVLKNFVFTPDKMLESYVSAVAEGRFESASKMVDPGIENDSRVLLHDDAAKDASKRMQNVQVAPTHTVPNSPDRVAEVSYTLNGVSHEKRMIMQPSGRRMLFFNSWKINTPMIDTVNIAVPDAFTHVEVNGIDVDLAKAGMHRKSVTAPDVPSGDEDDVLKDMTSYALPTYPVVETAKLPQSKYFESDSVKLDGKDASVYLVARATAALKDDLLGQVRKHVDSCEASKDLAMQGCAFSNGDFQSYTNEAVTNITRSVTNGSVKLDRFSLSSSTFTTEPIYSRIAYQYRFTENEDWKDSTTTDSGLVSGKFSIKDDKLTVDFD